MQSLKNTDSCSVKIYNDLKIVTVLRSRIITDLKIIAVLRSRMIKDEKIRAVSTSRILLKQVVLIPQRAENTFSEQRKGMEYII